MVRFIYYFLNIFFFSELMLPQECPVKETVQSTRNMYCKSLKGQNWIWFTRKTARDIGMDSCFIGVVCFVNTITMQKLVNVVEKNYNEVAVVDDDFQLDLKRIDRGIGN